ncbi:MAG: hypothetical protein R2746_13285 [Acidimicrobiales bacterium]|nr:hypothetical protein [Actinomycetota bacterium]
MYLFTRQTRLLGGHGSAGLEWAGQVCGAVQDVTGHEVQLWASVYSPGFGTVSWTAWVEDLAQLESIGDQLSADAGYAALVDKGAAYGDGVVDDALMLPLHGAPDAATEVTYVSTVSAVVTGGDVARSMAAGIAIAEQAEKATGLTTMFVQALTGPYGSVGWLSGYADIAAVQAAQEALAADPGWPAVVDASDGCFAADPASTQQRLWRRLV